MIKFILSFCFVSVLFSSSSYGMYNGDDEKKSSHSTSSPLKNSDNANSNEQKNVLATRWKELTETKALTEEESKIREKALTTAVAELCVLKRSLEEYTKQIIKGHTEQTRSQQLRDIFAHVKAEVAQFKNNLLSPNDDENFLIISEVKSTNIKESDPNEIGSTLPSQFVEVPAMLYELMKHRIKKKEEQKEIQATIDQFVQSFFKITSAYQESLVKLYAKPTQLKTEYSENLTCKPEKNKTGSERNNIIPSGASFTPIVLSKNGSNSNGIQSSALKGKQLPKEEEKKQLSKRELYPIKMKIGC